MGVGFGRGQAVRLRAVVVFFAADFFVVPFAVVPLSVVVFFAAAFLAVLFVVAVFFDAVAFFAGCVDLAVFDVDFLGAAVVFFAVAVEVDALPPSPWARHGPTCAARDV